MEDNLKFTIAVDNLDKKIAELNIKISKNPNNNVIIQELNGLLNDREKIFKGNAKDLKILIEKYASKKDE